MDKTLQRIPFIRILLPFMAGIAVQYHYDLPGVYLAGFILSLLSFAAYWFMQRSYDKRWLFGLFVLSFYFAAGSWSMHSVLDRIRWEPPSEDSYTAVLEEYPSEKKKTVLCRLRLDSGQRVMAYFAKDSLSLSLTPGEVLHFRGKFKALEKSPEPLDFDYGLYLKKQGYSASGYVAAEDWEPVGRRFHVQYKALECQRYLALVLKETGLSDDAYAFGATMLLGCRDLMDADLTKSFAVSGISHVISISGLHAQIIFAMFCFLFGFFGAGRKGRIARQLIILSCMWIFTFISGLYPPVVRASAMLSLFGIADMLGKSSHAPNVLLASAFLMLLYNPLYLFDVSFQLSYLAMLSIVVVYPRLEGLHRSDNPVVRYLWASFCISIAAQWLTAPLCMYYFHQFPVYFWIANVVIAPLVGPALIGMIASLALHPLLGFPLWVYQPVDWMLRAIVLTADAVEKLPYALVAGLHIDEWQLLFLYGMLLGLVTLFVFKRKKGAYAFLSFVLFQVIYYL